MPLWRRKEEKVKKNCAKKEKNFNFNCRGQLPVSFALSLSHSLFSCLLTLSVFEHDIKKNYFFLPSQFNNDYLRNTQRKCKIVKNVFFSFLFIPLLCNFNHRIIRKKASKDGCGKNLKLLIFLLLAVLKLNGKRREKRFVGGASRKKCCFFNINFHEQLHRLTQKF